MVNEAALLAFLDGKADERDPHNASGLVIASIYAGLASRIRSGEFNYKVIPEPEDFVMPGQEDEDG